MLDQLTYLTSTETYKFSGGILIKEISIKPPDIQDAKFVFEIWIEQGEVISRETWEITCTDLAQTEGIPQFVIPGTQLKLFNDHPVLWHLDDEIFFSITGKCHSIPALMGELFIEHTRACGCWVDFNWLYGRLPQTLENLTENELSIPVRLKDSCFQVLERHGIQCRVNTVQNNEKGYWVLFFSNPHIWPDELNFSQSYIIAKEFAERKILLQ